MALKDRLQLLIDKEGLNPNQFYVKTGLGNGFLNTVGEKLRKPSVEKIEKSFPHWNIDYIQTGKGDMLRPTPQISGNILVGDSNKNVQLGHGSKIMHGNETDQEVMSSLQARIIELETELIKKNGEIAVKDETIKGKDKEIKGLQEQLILKTEMITLLQNHNNK